MDEKTKSLLIWSFAAIILNIPIIQFSIIVLGNFPGLFDERAVIITQLL